MLLTVFYVAATWMQSRRLGSLRRKINQFANNQASIVFYKILESNNEANEEIPVMTTSSLFCKNIDKVMVGEVLYFSSNIRSCVLLPQQVIDVENWLTCTDETPFPVKHEENKIVLKTPKLFLLVEAKTLANVGLSNAYSCNINQIGIPKAWRAAENLGVIIESDSEHLTKFSSLFLSFPIIMDIGFEINRIQTVTVVGKPCIVIKEKQESLVSNSTESQIFTYNLSESSSRHQSLQTLPSFWKNHMEILRNYSKCSDLTTISSLVSVPDQSASIIPGTTELKLESPEMPDVSHSSSEDKIMDLKENSYFSGIKVKNSSPQALELHNKSCDSSNIVSAQSTPSRQSFCVKQYTFSSLQSLNSNSSLSLSSASPGKNKPPNILIYAESPTTYESIKTILNETLNKYKYTIYRITESQLVTSVWAANCFLLVICGNVPQQIESILTTYLILGGKLLCLCSSFLHTLLPTFRTAEVRERELVHFSYKRWKRVRLMHHVFCYQNSPSRAKFSGDSDDALTEKDKISPVPQAPSSVEVIDNSGVSHTLHVQVLGVEETWQTPSLLLAYFPSPGGCAVFSQVHLELDPCNGSEYVEEKEVLHSTRSRKEIIRDILSTHLGMETDMGGTSMTYTVAYFLGIHETKLDFIEKNRHLMQDGILKLGLIGIKFCGKGEIPPAPTANLLPVLIHSCPRDFSTLEYFENLGTKFLGRILIYSEVLGSSMDIVNGELAHGFAVVPSQQISGKGRTSNQWLSPPGCAMFSLQVHLPSDSYLGRHPSVLQHIVSAAIVSCLSEIGPEYEKAFDLHLKWPNDIYTTGLVKIGGLIVTCFAGKTNIIFNIGCGINLDNESPTTCLNALIKDYNKKNNLKLKKLSRERLLAGIFTQLEKFFEKIEEGNIEFVENTYYKYWLHGGAEIRVADSFGSLRQVIVLGIDEFGFLKVQERSGNVLTVHPDGNSFDMMEGLIAPKLM